MGIIWNCINFMCCSFCLLLLLLTEIKNWLDSFIHLLIFLNRQVKKLVIYMKLRRLPIGLGRTYGKESFQENTCKTSFEIPLC